jgi:hypothetical protein
MRFGSDVAPAAVLFEIRTRSGTSQSAQPSANME